MPNPVSKWIRKKVSEKKGKPPVPVLPETRPRPLTPSDDQACRLIAPNGSFFERIPPEIRRQILVTAFGDRTVHMDLYYDYPPIPRPNNISKSSHGIATHCGLNVRRSATNREVENLDESSPKQWIWRSSVCHRDHPRCRRRAPGYRVQPSDDRCRFGDASNDFYCDYYPGRWPSKCFIGAMGWLLSCRQAYLEGVEVLYSTNTIHTSSKEMVMQLPRLLPPPRLASIKSMEVIWEFVPFPRHERTERWPAMTDLDSLCSFLEAAPSIFGNVKNLYISLQGQLQPPSSNFPASGREWLRFTEELIMCPVDEMVRKLGPGVKECSIAVPSSLYAGRRDLAKQTGGLVEQTIHGGDLERHWRPLEGSEFRTGYWVRLGQKDWLPNQPACRRDQNPNLEIEEEDRVLYSWVVRGGPD